MLKEYSNNKKNNFIEGWYMDDPTICDKLINFYEQNSQLAEEGTTGGDFEINYRKKRSFDLSFEGYDNRPILVSYKKNVQDALELYKQKYKYCDLQQAEWGLYEGYNIQKYPKGGGFPAWHYENTGRRSAKRHLVFMTYLNDVKKNGETEFFYQKLKIKPKKGLTLIWPATWEYTHRGNICKEQEKYIVTGWYSYKND